MSELLRLVDLFSGCGGLTDGFMQTGRYVPVAAVEMDASAAATYAQNFGDHVHVGDIRDWVQGPLPLAEVVIGGPPCQGFSPLGKQDPDDPRNNLWLQYVDAIRRIRPVFFVIENVPQFLKSGQYALLERETTSPKGNLRQWRLETHILRASDYGTAQVRRRAIVVGRPKDLPPLGAPMPHLRIPTVRDALAKVSPDVSAINPPSPRAIEFRGNAYPGAYFTHELHFTRQPTPISLARYQAIPPGGNRRDLPDELQMDCWRRHTSGAGDVMGRLTWDKPSVTIRTEFFKPEKGRYLHPSADRAITHYEAALIQGFREDFRWVGSKAAIARQIGNAVPPPMALSIGNLLAKHILRRAA
ncbi:DNA cytosine methyltransferase [Serinicoccus sediminis]|uniref:DNA cytosine methyltransferase n=1 Tax=Serinicoccus sediminis TaxID=2306021 RepID=UPI00102269C2|nr:DNA cytosine methyltransferase [Serinicoccus sediminis]